MSILNRIFLNNASAVLSAPIEASDTSVSVIDGTVFGTIAAGKHIQATLQKDNTIEIVAITARSGNTLTLQRGLEGTTPASFIAGSQISVRITKDTLDQIVAYLATLPPPYTDTYFGTLAALSYDSVLKGALGAEIYSNGIVFSDYGSELFVITSNGKIRRFSLEVGWDITTASFVSQVDWAATYPSDLHNSWTIDEDGLVVTVSASQTGDPVIKQYTLSTAWNLATATLTRTTSVLSYFANRMSFNHDGSKLLTYDSVNKSLRCYDLPTAFNVTGLMLGSSVIWVEPFGNNHQNFLPNGDFSKVLWTSQTSGGFMMRILTLSTPGDLTTATVTETLTSPANMQWHDAIQRGPSKLYVLANVADSEILQFSW